MDYWLPESSCGLFKTSCCLKETLAEAFPPSSFLRWLISYSSISEANWPRGPSGTTTEQKAGRRLVLECFTAEALLRAPSSPGCGCLGILLNTVTALLFCVGLLSCTTHLREEVNEKLVAVMFALI